MLEGHTSVTHNPAGGMGIFHSLWAPLFEKTGRLCEGVPGGSEGGRDDGIMGY